MNLTYKNVIYNLQLFALSNGGELRREEWCIDSDTDEEGTMKLKSFVCQCDGFRIWTYFEVGLINFRLSDLWREKKLPFLFAGLIITEKTSIVQQPHWKLLGSAGQPSQLTAMLEREHTEMVIYSRRNCAVGFTRFSIWKDSNLTII